MGMFDELYCKYPLPVSGLESICFQTKDTPAQFLDLYEIRNDGTFWHETYDIEDQSDPQAEGIRRLAGLMARVNQRWERLDFKGEVVFYGYTDSQEAGGTDELFVFSAYFVDGILRKLQHLKDLP